MSLNVCIFGVSGYTGSKLLYYLDKHKHIKIHGVFGNSTAGIKLGNLFKNLNKSNKIKISKYEFQIIENPNHLSSKHLKFKLSKFKSNSQNLELE